MGLDMYLYKRLKNKEKDPVEQVVDDMFSVIIDTAEKAESEELHCWRKHPDLHGWMEKLYYNKGGKEIFNCQEVVLSKEDIENLLKDIKEDKMEKTYGFFFGETQEEFWKEDIEFFTELLDLFNFETHEVVYDSWW